MNLYWGDRHEIIYNDSYISVSDTKKFLNETHLKSPRYLVLNIQQLESKQQKFGMRFVKSQFTFLYSSFANFFQIQDLGCDIPNVPGGVHGGSNMEGGPINGINKKQLC